MNLVLRSQVILRAWSAESRASAICVTAAGLLVGGLLYLGLPVFYLPVLLAGGLLVLVTLRSPSLGLSFVIASLFFPTLLGGLTLLQLTGSIVAVVTLIWYGVNKRGFVIANVTFPILVFVILDLHSLSFTRDPAMTEYTLRKLIFNAILCLLLVNLIDNFEKIRRALWILAAAGILNSIMAIYQTYAGETSDSRSKGLQENENVLGEVAAVSFIIPFYLFLYGDRLWKRLTGLGLCAILSSGLIASVSRGASLAFLGGLLFILVRERQRWPKLLGFGVLAICALPLIPEFFMKRFTNIGNEVRGTVVLSERHGLSSRGYYNKAGIKIWKAHPVLGVGFGNYGFYYVQPDFNPGLMGKRNVVPHNIYIQALAETGTVGFLVLCWWILLAAYNYWVAEKKTRDGTDDRLYLRACEGLTLVTLITFFSGGSLIFTHLAMVLGFSSVCRRCAENLEGPRAMVPT